MPAEADNLPKANALTYESLGGWNQLDHVAGFSCFLKSAEELARQLPNKTLLGASPESLREIGRMALELAAKNRDIGGKLTLDNDTVRSFFETHFTPVRYNTQSFAGFVTGYYEPEVAASRTRHGKFRYPIHRVPDDLVKIDDATRPKGMDASFRFARKTPQGISEYFDRGEIQKGALNGKGYEIFWLEDPGDVFFIHVQGSARLALDDGNHVRITYAAKSGHPYTPIGRILIERGEIAREAISMDAIRAWLKSHPDQVEELFSHNRSYIFFAELGQEANLLSGPIAAAGVALTPGHSIAVDRTLHTFGTPVFLRTAGPLPWENIPFSRLMTAQDTGSAIIGAERGDLFIGSGAEAGKLAGWIRHQADFVFLLPKAAIGG